MIEKMKITEKQFYKSYITWFGMFGNKKRICFIRRDGTGLIYERNQKTGDVKLRTKQVLTPQHTIKFLMQNLNTEVKSNESI